MGAAAEVKAVAVPEVKAAAKCTDTDKKTWDADAGHAQWQKQLTSCGFKCLGKQSCVTSCMQGMAGAVDVPAALVLWLNAQLIIACSSVQEAALQAVCHA